MCCHCLYQTKHPAFFSTVKPLAKIYGLRNSINAKTKHKTVLFNKLLVSSVNLLTKHCSRTNFRYEKTSLETLEHGKNPFTGENNSIKCFFSLIFRKFMFSTPGTKLKNKVVKIIVEKEANVSIWCNDQRERIALFGSVAFGWIKKKRIQKKNIQNQKQQRDKTGQETNKEKKNGGIKGPKRRHQPLNWSFQICIHTRRITKRQIFNKSFHLVVFCVWFLWTNIERKMRRKKNEKTVSLVDFVKKCEKRRFVCSETKVSHWILLSKFIGNYD